MEDNENPYSVLGVPEDATEAQIKAAYRKLALRHHPDKQRDDESRRAATVQFAKISNAYEILSDARQRQEYDQAQRFGGTGGGASGGGNFDPRYHQGGFGGGHDDFFTSSFHRSHPFHDPFEVFERAFRDEFGASRGGRDPRAGAGYHQQDPFGSSFHDDFFGRPMMDPFGGIMGGGFPSIFGGSLFGGGFPGGMGGPRGGRFRDPFEVSPFEGMFESMRFEESMRQRQQQSNGNPSRSGNYSTYTVTSSSSTFGGGNRGESVTTQTTTRIVNGERQTVTERIVRKADGTVERQVLEDTNGGGARLTNGSSSSSSSQAATTAALPASSSRRRRSETNQSSVPSQRRRHSGGRRRQEPDDERY